MSAKAVMEELNLLEDPAQAQFATRFFRTGKGDYGENDVFLGLRVPAVRRVARSHQSLSLGEIETLLESSIHEHRLAGLVIMTEQSKRADEEGKKLLYDLYLRRTDRINNWDLVDVSCREIVGGYLLDKPRDILYKLARSDSLWERRIAIVSTWQFIREGQLLDTFALAKTLLTDTHDLIHKATGWMLREAGKKDESQLKNFLESCAHDMPRTMLRYALERLSPDDRYYYMRLRTR